jgi:beta-N-acetylhexosaminidase
MSLSLEQAIHQMLLLSFHGETPPAELLDYLRVTPAAGFTLFRGMNLCHPAQVRALTSALQQAASEADPLPLLLATDQEGGQLLAIGE